MPCNIIRDNGKVKMIVCTQTKVSEKNKEEFKMTNYEKLKHGTKKEIIELLKECTTLSLGFGTKWCNELCEYRCKENDCCTLPCGECAYTDEELLIEKWLDVKV